MYVDDVVITPLNCRAWQKSLGYVPQHIFLADETVAANIAICVPDEEIDLEAVERAEAQAPSELSELFTDVYAERPWHLREQEEQALRDRGRKQGAPNE